MQDSEADPGDEDRIVAAAAHAPLPVGGPEWTVALHPFGDDDPRFAFIDPAASEVAEPGAALRHRYTLRGTDYAQRIRVDFRQEQRCAVAEYMAVVSGAAGVDQKQAAAAGNPVLLGVVVAQLFAIIEPPFDRQNQ